MKDTTIGPDGRPLSPTLALAKQLGIAVLHPPPACVGEPGHYDRPAAWWVVLDNPPGAASRFKICEYCAANYRARARHEPGIHLLPLADHPDGPVIQQTLL